MYILKNVYFSSKLLLRKILLKTNEHLIFSVIFQTFLFFLCRDPSAKEIVPHILPKRFRLG